ncbi:PilZ domain-containing protein [Gilvimarinus sp. SDUM040013]|uniref:PilZ domain-containing protein n=1 Tax=Gilvimarinus gilvus TaxID=3058038 RepID=A0ABU4S147_9GAMM|nr:PilZ domain-containing protein [Gilvimarinus sp. SDUM040013]MDO3387157.1 PilZ domain-containing protein [Gilvimarinus sp. SDUM040013]MDX6850900.1 PilZ domain-containing protein [Gilvimarinus sp. SDUM040013]
MDDRREYFRIDVQANIDMAVLTAQPTHQEDPASHFSASPVLRAMAELKKLDGEAVQLQQQIKDSDRALGEYLHVMSRKIDVLAVYCLTSSTESQGDYGEITISEGGLSFIGEQAVKIDDWVALMLIFAHPTMAIALHGQITRCEPDPDKGYQIAAEFRYENSAQRQQISQQIMRSQMESIRSNKT